MTQHAHALVYRAPGEAVIEEVALAPLGPGEVAVETQFSALSRGTERLVFEGRVPQGEWERMRAPLQVGAFPFPVRYGYAAVGRVTALGPGTTGAAVGTEVFCLHPHQDRFHVSADMVLALPAGVPASRAVLAANMETALNAVWDARPRPGSRCLVVGAGLLGWLVAMLLAGRVDMSITVTDIRAQTGVTDDEKCVTFCRPEEVPDRDFDLAFHTSASAAGLQTAIDALAFEGEVIELSWYGDRAVEIALGGNFHAGRLAIRASQVGHVAPARRAGTTRRERLALALEALSDPRFDRLLTDDVAFADLPAALPHLLSAGAPGIATRISY